MFSQALAARYGNHTALILGGQQQRLHKLEHANYLQQDGPNAIGIRQIPRLRQCLTVVNFPN